MIPRHVTTDFRLAPVPATTCWIDEAGDRLPLSLRGGLLLIPRVNMRLPAVKK